MEAFTPRKALQYAAALSYPRAAGTSGEITARQQIADQLARMGWQVRIQPFEYSTALEAFLKFEILIGQILILVTLGLSAIWPGLGLIPTALLLLHISLAFPLNQSVLAHSLSPRPGEAPSLWKQLCRSLGARLVSANILAELSESPTSPNVPHLILMAHCDSKSQRLPLAVRLALFTASLGGALLFAGLTFLSPAVPQLTPISQAAAITALSTSLPLLWIGCGNSSPGAVDNASGVGLVLHLAEVLAGQPQFHRTPRISILISGAEEQGTMGAQAYLQAHSAALKDQANVNGLHVLNFDGIGIKGELCLVAPLQQSASKDGLTLSLTTQEACAQLGLKLRRLVLPGAMLDHMPFARAGLDAVSLIAIGRNSRFVHTPQDTAEKLDLSGFDQAGRTALQIIQRLSQLRDGSPGSCRNLREDRLSTPALRQSALSPPRAGGSGKSPPPALLPAAGHGSASPVPAASRAFSPPPCQSSACAGNSAGASG